MDTAVASVVVLEAIPETVAAGQRLIIPPEPVAVVGVVEQELLAQLQQVGVVLDFMD
jgi:hypothetical protein